MNETQLFYLTIMIALFVLYLIITKICEAYEIKYKSLAMSNMKLIDLEDNEELKEKLIQAVTKKGEE